MAISEKETPCYNHYIEDIHKNAENRYEVCLPFKENHPLIHDHFEPSKKRLVNIYKRFKDDKEFLKQYDNVFKEKLEAGIIEEVTEEREIGQTHYLPHHPVIRNDKATTKLRVVFDESARSKAPSLNSCLDKGPQLTPLLFDILIRFRSKNVPLAGDIEKAFLQIAISENDRNYLRFLWFDDVFKEFPSIVEYHFTRVVLGVTSSPFLLSGTIQKHVKNYNYDPEFITTVLRSFFVDDFTGGSNNAQNTFELFKLKIRFLEGKFNVTKWRTNHAKLRQLNSDCESTEQLSGEEKF